MVPHAENGLAHQATSCVCGHPFCICPDFTHAMHMLRKPATTFPHQLEPGHLL